MIDTAITTRRHRLAWAAVLLLAATTLLSALPGPVAAASSVQIEARPLVGGRYQVGGWAAVSVTLVNPGEPTDGYLLATSDAGTVRRYVELPAGARKVVPLYLQPDAFQRRVEIRYEEPNGTVRSTIEVRVLESASRQAAIVGDGAGTIRPQLASGVDGAASEPIALGPGDIPERPEPLAGLDSMVWAGDSAGLTEGQRRSLERWVAEGGDLVVIGGADWQARTGGLTELLPLESLASVDGTDQSALARWTGSDAPAIATDAVSGGTLRDGARALVSAEDGTVLVSMIGVGAGRVIFLGVDAATDPYRGWEGSPRLWGRLLPSGAAIEEFFGFPGPENVQDSMSQALGNLPSLEVPAAEVLLIVIVGYILLIGPVSYLILRRLDRRELAWVTAPLLVVLFTACSYGIGSVAKGGDVIVNQISVIRSSGVGSSATVETYAGIFSPSRATYDLSVDADALVGRLRPSGFQNDASSSVADQGQPAYLRSLGIGVFGFEGVSAAGQVEHTPSLEIAWRAEGEDLIGTVTNIGSEPLDDVAYISQSTGEMIGPLEPGASADFEVARVNFNGSAASEQVYGFGGFDNQTEAQRQALVRRQVIDSLVGYGGIAPGVDLGPMHARGPYVIAWRDTDGPMPLSVDGLDAVRSAVAVEVLSVRPLAASGEVTISPAQMSVAVTEVEGNASVIGTAVATVTDGTATFTIGLPLEAAGMAVTELELLAGPDPAMAIGEQGGFGGFWREGTLVELRDPETGEWIRIGDLSESSKIEIDDAAAAFGDTGLLTVRVSGPPADPQFGETGVFLTARASGVIDE